ncbi:MAG: glycosyltransferase family 39 protein [Phycisphaerae bacterium]
MKTRRTVILLMIVQLAFIILLRADFLTDWDSYLYTFGALKLHPVGLAGGRWFFTAFLGSIWRFLNLFHTISPDSAWLVFSFTTIIFALVNVWLFFSLACRWIEREAALVATALFISSPLTGMYGSAVMTETAALTTLLATLLILFNQPQSILQIVLAGIIFGLGCAIREPLVLLAILPLGLIFQYPLPHGCVSFLSKWVRVSVFLSMIGVVFLLNFLFVLLTAGDWDQISQSWAMGMARERMQMIGWLPRMLVVNFFCLVCWLAIFSPVLLITIPEQIRLFRAKRTFWMIPTLAAGGLYCVGLIANHSLVFNPRFILFPAALLCLPAALGLWRKIPVKLQNPWLIGGLLVALHFSAITLFWSVFEGYYFDKSNAARQTWQTLSYAPNDALFIPGRLTPAVELYKNLHNPDWHIIYAGWDFSDKELMQEIEKSRRANRQTFIVEPQYWAEKRFRETQYMALESVWNRYPHHPCNIAHFSQLDLPPNQAPREFFRRLINLLFS